MYWFDGEQNISTMTTMTDETAREIAYALLGSVTMPMPEEPHYLADAPAITDLDAPWEIDGWDDPANDPENFSDGTSNYDPNPWDTDDALDIMDASRTPEAYDTLGFERGYAAAVDDMRHGLMNDEVMPVERPV